MWDKKKETKKKKRGVHIVKASRITVTNLLPQSWPHAEKKSFYIDLTNTVKKLISALIFSNQISI